MSTSHRSRALGLGLGVAAVSTGAILARLAQAPALALSFWRCALAGTVLLLWAAPSLRAELARLERRGRLLLAGSGLCLALHFASWITSLEYTSVASSVLLVNTGPIWVGLLGHRVTGEPLERRAAVGIASAVAGSALVAGGDLRLAQDALLGDGLALLGALSASAYLLLGRILRRELSLGVYAGSVYAAAALALAAASLGSGVPLSGFSGSQWGWILALALAPQLVGHTAANWALGHANAALVAVSLLGEPLLAGAWAALFLDEVPPRGFFIGAPWILLGILLVALPRPGAGTQS